MSKELNMSRLHGQTQQHLEQHDYVQAQELAWQQLDIDPLHEPALQQLMTALARSGQRSAAMAQYEIYRQRLEEASGDEPSAELRNLYTRIQNDELQQTMLRIPAKLPDDTSTINPIFCYTDIENSTRLWDEHREAMLWALRQHNDLCEIEIERYDGRILHPTGDGFLIVFEQNDPLQFAISLQQRFAQADWGEIGELRIRIGLHGATAEQEGHAFFHDDGGWYRGPVLNHAARIADTGHGGQIVASDMVKATCPLPPGAFWEDLGSHNLKSLEETYHINGLLHPDLALQEFPALRTPANKKKAQAGDSIRGYELGPLIGQGAFGEVYQAQQPGIGRPVAVKKIRARFANQPEFIRRFEAEAQVVARLEHPHIVPLYDYWREADGAFLVMRYMRGGSLKGMLEIGALDLDTALVLMDQVGSALAFAHQQGFVHRDIKPANILLDETGNGYLSDFGIVKDLSIENEETPSGSITGTPAYLSPEQALSQEVSPLSDQYSLGVMLYEMLTGTKPFDDTSSPSALLAKQVQEPLPLVSTTHPALPPAVDEVIQRATAKEAGARFKSIPAMIRALHIAAQKDGKGLALPAGFVQLEEELVNPYKGLRSFQEADAVNFFGRKALVEQLLTRFAAAPESGSLPTDRFLTVVGPSGGGKSSVVKAGLLPALRRGAVPGAEKWFIVEMIPGTHPLEELGTALLRIAVDPPPSLLQHLQEDERGLVRALDHVLPDDGSELLLVVDQFEELFTLVEDDERRTHFINSLLVALNKSNSRLRVVVTLRADFYDRPLLTPGLAELMRSCMEIVPPLNKAELEEVIVQPAMQVGAIFEDGLVPLIIDDVSEQPGALPLLQYALTELFERRQERLLTQAAYQEIGGVLGALARRAEELYTQLDEEGEEAARQLFMRLVTLGEGMEDTRRRVLRSELMGLQTSEVLETSEILDAYGRYRLLTFDRDPLTREPTVEVAHEALLRDWPRLRQWLDENRDDVRLQRTLAAFAAEWAENDQNEGFLLRGSRLDLLSGWAAATTLALTPGEQKFLQASVDAREKRHAAEQERQRRELETAQQLAREQTQRAEEQASAAAGFRRRAYILAGVLVIALLLAIAAGFFANQSSQNAETAVAESNQRATAQAIAETESASRATAEAVAIAERDTAEEQTQLSTSREIALAALNNLDTDPELSILLALEALDVRPTNEAQEALHRALQESRVRIMVSPYEDNSVIGGAFSPDGTRFVTTDTAGTAIVWDAQSGEELVRFAGHAADGSDEYDWNWVNSPDFTPDGQKVATGGQDGTVRIWDPNTAEELLVIEAHEEGSSVDAVDFSADGSKLLTGGWDNTAKIWDVETGEQLLAIEAGHSEEEKGGGFTGVVAVDFSPDSSRFATSGVGGLAIVWDAESGEELLRLEGHDDFVHDVAFSPDGSLIATSSRDNTAKVWDAETGELLHSLLGHSNELRMLAFSPDSQRLATASVDGTAKIWELASGREMVTLAGHNHRVYDIAFSPDGSQVLTTGRDYTARVWDAGQGHEEKLTYFIAAHEARYSPDGQLVITTDDAGVVKFWDAASGDTLKQFEGTDWSGGAELSPDGTILAAAFDDGTAIVWDAQSGESLVTLAGHEDWANNLAISQDGSLLATAGQDGKVIIWDLDSGQEMMTLDHGGPAWGVDFTSDGAFLVSAGSDQQDDVGTVFLWDLGNGERVQAFEGHESRIKRSLFSPDDTKLLTAGWDGTARLWDVASGEELFLLGDHSGNIWGADYSPDGRMVATGSNDGSIKLWDANTGVALLTLVEGPDGINNVAFSPDGTKLIAAFNDGTLREYILPLDELTKLAHTRVTRTLTDEECRQYLHLDACPVQ